MPTTADSLHRIGVALHRTFPNLGADLPLRVLGEGSRSIVVETPEKYVFRIGKNGTANAGYRKEVSLLPRLRASLPIMIPDPRWYADPSDDFPFGVMGYPQLNGTPLIPEWFAHIDLLQVASDIAIFLAALHKFPTDEAVALGLPRSELRAREALRDAVLPELQAALTIPEYRTVTRWWDAFLRDEAMSHYQPVVLHGDLWYEHLLLNDMLQAVVRVLDFEDAAVGDPAQDIATQMYLDEPFTAAVIERYHAAGGLVNTTFHHRVQKLWEVREFIGIQFAIQTSDIAEFGDGIRKLRAGPILSSTSR